MARYIGVLVMNQMRARIAAAMLVVAGIHRCLRTRSQYSFKFGSSFQPLNRPFGEGIDSWLLWIKYGETSFIGDLERSFAEAHGTEIRSCLSFAHNQVR